MTVQKLVVLGLISVAGIAGILGSATTEISPEQLNQIERTIPKCETEKECERKWAGAQAWVAKNSGYKIQVATDSLIETYNSTDSSTRLAARVVKEPIGSTGYQFVVTVWCDNIYGCRPDVASAMLDFNRTVNAIATDL
jgi:hypothetical protein